MVGNLGVEVWKHVGEKKETETPRRNQTETMGIQASQSNWNIIKECFMNWLSIRMSFKENKIKITIH